MTRAEARGSAAARARTATLRRTAGVALLLPAVLAGCLATARLPVIGEARAPAPWLEGAATITDGAGAPISAGRIAALAPGLYRFEGPGAGWSASDLAVIRALSGRCAGLAETPGLAAEMAARGSRAEGFLTMLETVCAAAPQDACASVFERPGAGGGPAGRALCAAAIGLARDPSRAAATPEALVAPAAALRAIADGAPDRDRIAFASLPLGPLGAPDWALLEVTALDGRGRLSGFSLDRTPLDRGALMLARRASETEIELWSTIGCEGAPAAVYPSPSIAQTFARCAATIEAESAAGAVGAVRPAPWRLTRG